MVHGSAEPSVCTARMSYVPATLDVRLIWPLAPAASDPNAGSVSHCTVYPRIVAPPSVALLMPAAPAAGH